MKFLLILTALLTAGVGGVFATSKFSSASSTTSESLNVKSHSVSGNITDSRLNNKDEVTHNEKTILKYSVDKNRVIYMNAVVDSVSSKTVTDAIKSMNAKSSEPIFLLLDSPGGSVIDGASVINEMEASKAPVYTVCTRLCASMAAMIHSYGSKRYALDRAILMYHPATAGAQGQVANMLSLLNAINRYTDKMVANIVSRSKLNKADYEKLIAYELWIDSEDALAKGLTDGTVSLSVPSVPEDSLNQDSEHSNKKDKPVTAPMNFQMISPHLNLWETNAR